MAYSKADYRSIRLIRFFMKVAGFWSFKTPQEELILNSFLAYTVSAILFAISVEAVDLFYCWGDLDAVVYNACATMPLFLVLIKLSMFILRRDVVIKLIEFAENNFWRVDYNDFGMKVIKECESKGVLLVSIYTFLVSGTVFNYLLTPIVENIGKNETERILPFKLWLDLPLTVTPYFEIIFTVEALSSIHTGICCFCFDNLMCILIIHVVGQFKILQNRLKVICERYTHVKNAEDADSLKNVALSTDIYREFKSCVDQHRTLMDYIDKLESIFSLILLCQMISSSVLLCVTSFQALLSSCTFVRRLIFISHMFACSTQLLLFTWTCNEIIVESTKIGDAAYQSEWYAMPHNSIGVSFKQGLLFVIARVNRPCFLSAGKFCPMSLQTFTSILSTALSYFTLLRQMTEELEEQM